MEVGWDLNCNKCFLYKKSKEIECFFFCYLLRWVVINYKYCIEGIESFIYFLGLFFLSGIEGNFLEKNK